MLFDLTNKAEQNIIGLDELMIRAHDTVSALQLGGHKRRKSGLGEDFRQFRPYSKESDHPTDIDWRQSAKAEQIYVRDKELQTSQDNIIWLDKGRDMEFQSDAAPMSKLACAQIMAMSLAILLANSHEKIGYAGSHKKGHSSKALEQFGQSLLYAPCEQSFTTRKNSTLFLISDFLAPIEETQELIANHTYQANRIICLQILDPAERNLPYKGRVIFKPLSDEGLPHEIQSVEGIAHQYQMQIDAHINALQGHCTKNGITYALHTTDQNMSETLRDLSLTLMEASGA